MRREEKDFVRDFYETFKRYGRKVIRIESPLTESGIPDTIVVTDRGIKMVEFKIKHQDFYKKTGEAKTHFVIPWRPAQIAFHAEVRIASGYTEGVITMVKFNDAVVKLTPIKGINPDKNVTPENFLIQVFKDMEHVYTDWRSL